MKNANNVIEKISKAKLSKIINDPVKTANAVDLIYVADTSPGICRKTG